MGRTETKILNIICEAPKDQVPVDFSTLTFGHFLLFFCLSLFLFASVYFLTPGTPLMFLSRSDHHPVCSPGATCMLFQCSQFYILMCLFFSLAQSPQETVDLVCFYLTICQCLTQYLAYTLHFFKA